MGNQARDLVQQIRFRLSGVLNRITLAQISFGLILSITIGLALWLSFSWIEAGLWMQSSYRLVLLVVLLASILAILVWFVLRPFGKRQAWWQAIDEYDAAEKVGSHFPHINDRITNLLELSENRSDKSADPFLDRAVLNLGKEIEGTDFDAVENFRAPKRLLRFATIPLGLFILSSILAPGPFFGASARLFQPMQEFFQPASFSISSEPGDIEVLHGEPLAIRFNAIGTEIPSSGILAYQFDDEEVVQEISLEGDSLLNFEYLFDQIRRPLSYSFQLGDVETSNSK